MQSALTVAGKLAFKEPQTEGTEDGESGIPPQGAKTTWSEIILFGLKLWCETDSPNVWLKLLRSQITASDSVVDTLIHSLIAVDLQVPPVSQAINVKRNEIIKNSKQNPQRRPNVIDAMRIRYGNVEERTFGLPKKAKGKSVYEPQHMASGSKNRHLEGQVACRIKVLHARVKKK